ncbi:Ankyrin repeat domain-containing protein 13B [Acipenser ruthenus]|uniref:Ankyrin repeat domain-containing protein 13B n=1 Tax=Acipenser ruthenus TaxID=7906 RepID=A0A444UWP7_ACIRT|nr:Ankyrin repeat domain-containing protein 13B [Acipenser ruthenus]
MLNPCCVAQVYGASNVELITRTRTEHLADQHKNKSTDTKPRFLQVQGACLTVCSPPSPASCRGCEIPASLFEVPGGYSVLGSHHDNLREEEEDLLQFAIQQSLVEAGSEYDQVTVWEALTNSKPGTRPLSCDGSRLERPHPLASPQSTSTNRTLRSYDEQLRLAMELSAREQEEAEQRQRQEEEELERIIQLSLMEK